MDLFKLGRSLYNYLNNIYTITNILNNINPRNIEQTHKNCIEIRMPESLIDCLYAFFDKKIFIYIENGYDQSDVHLINTKAIIFRAFYHCLYFLKELGFLVRKDIVIN